MNGHLTNETLPRREPLLPELRRRFNRWSAGAAGLWTLELAGMAAAVSLGLAIGRNGHPATQSIASDSRQSSLLARRLDREQRESARLAGENRDLAARLEQVDLDGEIASLQAENQAALNDQLKRAVTLFRESRSVVLPPAPVPLPVHLAPSTTAAINKGAREGVVPDGKGGFVVVRRPSVGVMDALQHGLKKPPQVAALTPAELASGRRQIELASPLATVVRPGPITFRWSKAPGATGYALEVTDEKGVDALAGEGENIQPVETPLGLSWTLQKTLPSGTYRWLVTVRMPDGTPPRILLAGGKAAVFAVLDAARYTGLKSAEEQFAGNALELGVRYARLGMLDDAEAALIPLVAAYPDSGPVKRLLEQIRGWRRFRNTPR